MRILLAALGSRGDVQPMLALARELLLAGHDVLLSAPPDFAAWSAGLGVPFVAAGPSTEELLKEHAAAMGANPLRIVHAVEQMLSRHIPEWFTHVHAAAQGASGIVSAGQLVASSVAQKLGIPVIGVVYSPTLLRSSHHPPLMGTVQGLPRWVNSVMWSVSNGTLDFLLHKPFNAARAGIGLPPVASVNRCIFDEPPFLLAADGVVAPAPPDWAARDVTTTGPWFYEDDAALPADVEAFLEAGPPPVYVGFGSMVSADTDRVTRAVLEGASRGGRRVLLSKGWAGIGGGALPEGAMAVSGPMAHARLFGRVAAVVHHGGAGTMAAALRAGAPQVLVPHIMDQYYYAHRLATLGLAPRGIPVARLTADRLAAAVDATLALPPQPRHEASVRLRSADGLQCAAAAIVKRIAAAS